MKFTLKLAFTIIALVLLVALVILYITWASSAKTLTAQAEERLQEMASSTMDKIDRDFFERSGDLRMIATDPIIASRESSPQQITERLITYRDIYKTYTSLSFFDLNRVRIADTSGMSLGKQDSHFKEWDVVLQGRMSIASDIDSSKTLGLPVIFFATLVKDKNNQPFGIIMTRMPLDRLYEIFGNVSISLAVEEDIHIDLVNRDGLLIYSNCDRKGILIEKSPDWEAVKNRSEEKIGTIEHYMHSGTEDSIMVFCHEQGYLDFMGNGWTLMIHVPTRIVLASLIELRNSWILVILPSITLAIIVALFLSIRLSKPLTELRDAVAEVGKGNLDTRVKIRSRDEIGDLGDYFNKMVENLKRTTTSIDNLEREITERKKAEGKLRLLATHDGLTGLPNRALLYDRFDTALANAQRKNKKVAIMSLDLDRFKNINDTLGHDVGDKLLVNATGRLTSMLRKVDTVARMGGDEFVLLLWEVGQKDDAIKVAQKILEGFRQPFIIDEKKLNITVSIGVAIYPEDGKDIKDLLKNSDELMYRAKESGRDRYQLCDGITIFS